MHESSLARRIIQRPSPLDASLGLAHIHLRSVLNEQHRGMLRHVYQRLLSMSPKNILWSGRRIIKKPIGRRNLGVSSVAGLRNTRLRRLPEPSQE